MIAQPFLLAIPRRSVVAQGIAEVSRPSEVAVEGPALFRDSATRVIDLGPRGIILGALFRRGVPTPTRKIDGPYLDARAADLAAGLVRDYWGAYLAVLIDPVGGEVRVMPDPSGLLPVYRAETRSHVLLSNSPRLFAAAGRQAPAVSWPDLRAYLVRPDLRRAETCLREVRELRPGTLWAPARGQVEGTCLWRPDEFMPQGPGPSFGDAVAELRSCAIETVGAWAGLAGSVAVAASGGVDSSLICAALHQCGHPFGCLTLATIDPSCDERAFVRALADHLEVRCIAATYDSARVDPLRPASAGLARPSRKTFMQALDAALDEGREQLGAAAVFDGNGGDSLFCFVHSAAPVLDCLAADGLRPALAAFVEMCGVTGCDIFTMAQAVARRASRGSGRNRWPPDLRLLAGTASADLAIDPLTRWLETDVGAHQGKLDHLSLIMHSQNHLHGLGETIAPRFSPLLSQPMVELCLSLPTWLWSHGGINRAPARAAFAEVLPSAIGRRTSKAGPDSFIRSLFSVHRERIRELLLDGRLVAQDIVDREAVAEAMGTDALSSDAIVYRLLDFLEAEVWARSWEG